MTHVYLSPHLDDAVLSCGGAIHRRSASEQEILVVTVFARDPAPQGDLSPFALLQHQHWGHPPQPMALRRAEDAAALTRLNARGQYLDYLDAVYRTGPAGEWLYDREEVLWEELHPADSLSQEAMPELAERLFSLFSPVDQHLFYAPLGIGHHVDHQLVHQVGRQLLSWGCRVAFYEDYPYAEDQQALSAVLQAAGGEQWRSERISLDATDLCAKVDAIGYYRSQMSVLFGGAQAMPSRVWAFAATRSAEGSLAERLWWPSDL